MGIADRIIQFFRNRNEENNVPDGFCPNCWGRQEYEGAFFEAVHAEKIDLNNIDEKKGWIQAYAARNLEGIQLRKSNDQLVCPSCKLSYRIA